MLMSLDASESRATIRDRSSGKGEEKATTSKTLADPAAGDGSCWAAELARVILVVLYLLLGGNPQALFESQQQAQLSQTAQFDNHRPRDEASKFVAVVLADTEDAWHAICRQMGARVRGAEAGALHGR